MIDALGDFFGSLGYVLTGGSGSSARTRLLRAYRKAYAEAGRNGDWSPATLSSELKNHSVPGAYSAPSEGALRDVFEAWASHVTPKRFAKDVAPTAGFREMFKRRQSGTE